MKKSHRKCINVPPRLLKVTCVVFVLPLMVFRFAHAGQSVVNVPISMALEDLSEVISNELPSEFEWDVDRNRCYDGWRIPIVELPVLPSIDCTANIIIRIDEKPSLLPQGESVQLSAPVTAEVTVRGVGLLGGLTSLDSILEAHIKINLKPVIRSDWSISSGLVIDYDWKSEPVIRVGQIYELSIESYLDEFIAEQQLRLNGLIDSELNNTGLREKVREVWARVQQPIRLGSTSEAYLKVLPKSIAMGALLIDSDRLMISTRLIAELEVGTDNSPPQVLTKVPPVEVLNGVIEATSLDVRINVPLARVSEEISLLLRLPRREPLTVEENIIAVLRAESFSLVSEDKMSITAQTIGSIEIPGEEPDHNHEPIRLVFQFTPELDVATRRLLVSELQSRLVIGEDGHSDALYQLFFADLEKLIGEYEGLPFNQLLGSNLTGLLSAEKHEVELSNKARLVVRPGEWSLERLRFGHDELIFDVSLAGDIKLEIEH